MQRKVAVTFLTEHPLAQVPESLYLIHGLELANCLHIYFMVLLPEGRLYSKRPKKHMLLGEVHFEI